MTNVNENIENENPEVITLRVSRLIDGSAFIGFSISNENTARENSRAHDGGLTESDDINAFKRNSITSKVTSRELQRITHRWTSTAIGFFNIIPEFASRNYEAVGGELAQRVEKMIEPLHQKKNEFTDQDGSKITEYEIALSEFGVVAKLLGKSSQALGAVHTMSQAALGALLSEYEAFMVGLLVTLARNRPSVFIKGDESIRIEDLEAYTSYSEFFDDLIEAKILELTQAKSHIQVIKWIEERFGVNLTSNQTLMAEFVEICQRRHIISHNGGVVNRRYREICMENGYPEKNLPKVGDPISIDRKYLRQATARIYQVGYFTAHILWQKLLQDHVQDSIGNLLECSHDFLESDLTKMCERICSFVLLSKTPLEAKIKAYFVINLAQSYLFDASLDDDIRSRKVEAALRKHDWSMTSPTVDLALACLRRDFDNLEELSKRATDDGVTRVAAMTWSIFREARDIEDFRKVFLS